MIGGITTSPITTESSQFTTSGPENIYENNKALFWGSVVVELCIGVIAIVGNGLVIYAAHGNNNTGRLRYLDNAVKSLAVADMLFGLMGIPLKLTNSYLSKNIML